MARNWNSCACTAYRFNCPSDTCPFAKAGAELLFDVINRAHEVQSLIPITNLPFDSWTDVLGSERLTGALPELLVDLKVTSFRQPQSSCPFKSARQKIFGLGYSLLVFVYEKTDDDQNRTGNLNIQHTIFVEAGRTADFQMTHGLRQIIDNDGNTEDLVAFMQDKNLPIDEIEATQIAEELLEEHPEQGYLTIPPPPRKAFGAIAGLSVLMRPVRNAAVCREECGPAS